MTTRAARLTGDLFTSFDDQGPTPIPDRTRWTSSLSHALICLPRNLYMNLNIQHTHLTQGLTEGWLDIRLVRMPSQIHIR
jgi:hypothetical protein